MMQESGEKYLNEMVGRAMKDDSRPAGNPYANLGSADSAYVSAGPVSAGPVNAGPVNAGRAQEHASGQKAGHGTHAKASPGKGKGGFFKGLISGTVISDSIILKDVRYSAMIFLLAVIFIANRFNAERVERDIAALEQEVRDLRAESLSVSADLGSVSRQSEISDLVKERGLGLEELREPPYRIVVNE